MPPSTPESNQNTIHEQRKLRGPALISKNKLFLLLITGLSLIALVIFIVVALMAGNSTPDQKLYDFKTKVVEKVIRATKLSDSSKLGYNSHLLDKRVAELLALSSDNSTSTPEALDQLASLTQQHTGDSVWMIQNTNSLSDTEKITALAQITNATRAFETLTDDWDEFESINDYSSDIQNLSQDGLKAEIDKFASSSDSSIVSAFVGEQIVLVGEEIKAVAPGSQAQRWALSRIDEASESISDGQFATAIYALLKARQAIAVDLYLYAAERGEGVSAPTEADTAIPEGS